MKKTEKIRELCKRIIETAKEKCIERYILRGSEYKVIVDTEENVILVKYEGPFGSRYVAKFKDGNVCFEEIYYFEFDVVIERLEKTLAELESL